MFIFLHLRMLIHKTLQDFNSIQQAFKDKWLADAIFEKLVYFCSDGASVNRGLKNGLISKLREFYGDFVAFFWCLTNLNFPSKMHLRAPLWTTLLIFLYKCYKNSSKKWRELQELYQSLKGEFSFENNALHPAFAGLQAIFDKFSILKFTWKM